MLQKRPTMESYRRERITMKTKEELTTLKNEVEALNKKLAELSEDELNLVVGGIAPFEQFSGKLIGGVGSAVFEAPSILT